MSQLVEDSQFIIATHSPILIAYPDAQILQIENNQLKPSHYTDTGHYQITKNFLNDYEKIVSYLVSNDDD